MEFDVVVIGAGPAGLSAAIRLMQLAESEGRETTVCVVEKGSEVGAHILSGAVLEPRALEELFPDWQDRNAPLNTPVKGDTFYFYTGQDSAIKLPGFAIPRPTHNDGNYIVSMGNVCRWLAEQAEGLGVEIYPGFTAAEVLFDDTGAVKGIATGEMGVGADGAQKDSYVPSMELHARYTVFAEGCRGHLGKQLISHFSLDEGKDPQHYGIGIKEVWKIDPEKHQEGLVVHGIGWPLSESKSSGGAFLYHAENHEVYLGLIADLNYSNPHLSPFEEFQRWKTHSKTREVLEGGERIAYGARALAKGGQNSLPEMASPGVCWWAAMPGPSTALRSKAITAMKSGMLAAESIMSALQTETPQPSETSRIGSNSLGSVRNCTARETFRLHAQIRRLLGAAMVWIDQNLFAGRMPFTLHDAKPDYACLDDAATAKPISYPKPDNQITFDRLSSVFLSNTNHEEDQPCHLTLKDNAIPISVNLPKYAEPAQRYCPAGVYEIVEETEGPRFQINAQNCVHCKTCDIKDPSQNITWVTPEGFGGPNYPNM